MSGAGKRYKHIFMSPETNPHQQLGLASALGALRAAAEDTRIRILALLSQGELSVSDLTDILGQSQPRISRHLKLLVEAGLLERHREGAWAFFRLSERPETALLLRPVLDVLDHADPQLSQDRERLAAVREQRAAAAQSFFARLAPRWDTLRSLHASEEAVEAAILDVLGATPIRSLLDLGTGTGRMLQLLGLKAERIVGLDASHAMLSVARANLERAGLAGFDLRQGDIYAPPLVRESFDLVIIHQVLHYLDDPARALTQAARLVAPGGRLLIVDFAPHGLEFLRETEGHRRLGFASPQVEGWLDEAGLAPAFTRSLPPPAGGGSDKLTVSIWLGEDRRVVTDWPLSADVKEVA